MTGLICAAKWRFPQSEKRELRANVYGAREVAVWVLCGNARGTCLEGLRGYVEASKKV